jgi:hypothetical protein
MIKPGIPTTSCQDILLKSFPKIFFAKMLERRQKELQSFVNAASTRTSKSVLFWLSMY